MPISDFLQAAGLQAGRLFSPSILLKGALATVTIKSISALPEVTFLAVFLHAAGLQEVVTCALALAAINNVIVTNKNLKQNFIIKIFLRSQGSGVRRLISFE